MIELIPEYVGRENPVIKRCSIGSGNGEFNNPRGISIVGLRMRFSLLIKKQSNSSSDYRREISAFFRN